MYSPYHNTACTSRQLYKATRVAIIFDPDEVSKISTILEDLREALVLLLLLPPSPRFLSAFLYRFATTIKGTLESGIDTR